MNVETSFTTSRQKAAKRRLLIVLTGIALGGLSTACSWANQAQPVVRAGPRPLTYLPAWDHESTAGLRSALLAQCQVAEKLGPPWPDLCQELAELEPGGEESDPQLRRWISARFDAWAITAPNGAARGLLTGYFEPTMTGSLTQETADQTPLYAPPIGVASGQAFAPRAQIADLNPADCQADETTIAKSLCGRELVWVDDPLDAFFLHIQGSGRIRLRNGEEMQVGYAGNNGHKYFAIGRALIERGEISRNEMSAQAIRQWLSEHREQAQEVMNLNPRYIFFRALPAPRVDFTSREPARAGPIGSLGVALTAGRSLATDPSFLPAGTLLYLATNPPAHRGKTALGRLAVSQDTGSAIQGAVRADLFTGTGAAAGEMAGSLRDPLQIWLLWPRGHRPAGKLPFKRPDLSD